MSETVKSSHCNFPECKVAPSNDLSPFSTLFQQSKHMQLILLEKFKETKRRIQEAQSKEFRTFLLRKQV